LHLVLEKNGIEPYAEILINWDRLEGIFKMSFADLDRFWDDIWYSAIDDIELFDESYEWMLAVDHHGCLFLFKAANEA